MIKLPSDKMVMGDKLCHTTISDRCAAPHGRLFEVLNINDRRVLHEINHNLVVVGGAVMALEAITGATASWKPSTLNEIHSVEATASGAPKLALFGVGTGGANLDFGSVIEPSVKQRDIISPVPLRYGTALSGDESGKYFMKTTNPDMDGTYSWYLKEFSKTPIIKSCWKDAVSPDEDGTEILSDIYNSEKSEGIESFIELEINLNTLDVREYFEATGELSTARYNTFGFYTGSKNAEGTEYADVRLYSVITFNNRDLSLPTQSQFVYRIYGLV